MKLHILTACVAALFICPTLHAEDAPKKAFNSEERLKRMTERLGLTADQQEKIKAIWEKSPELKELFSKGRENLTDADKTKIQELMKAQREQIDAVLTPEQRTKAAEWREKRQAEEKK
jgi:protein CpxP